VPAIIGTITAIIAIIKNVAIYFFIAVFLLYFLRYNLLLFNSLAMSVPKEKVLVFAIL
jgi:hypothetical protein